MLQQLRAEWEVLMEAAEAKRAEWEAGGETNIELYYEMKDLHEQAKDKDAEVLAWAKDIQMELIKHVKRPSSTKVSEGAKD